MDEDDGSRWAEWMAAAQDGDGAAYARLLGDVLPLLRRVVGRHWRLLGDHRDGGEDVVQDILLTLHRVRHTYDPARPFLPWLMSIVRHRLVDAARRHGRRGARESSIDGVDETFLAVEANTFSERDADIVRRAVAALPPGQRRAIELVKLGGLSLADASTASGMSVGALKVAVHRAVRTLKGMLGQPE